MEYKNLTEEAAWNNAYYEKEAFEYLDAQEGYDPLKDTNRYTLLEIDYREEKTRECFPTVNIHNTFCRIVDRFLKSAPDRFPNLKSCDEYRSEPILSELYDLIDEGIRFAKESFTRIQMEIIPAKTSVNFVFASESLFLHMSEFSFLKKVAKKASVLLIIPDQNALRMSISVDLFGKKRHRKK